MQFFKNKPLLLFICLFVHAFILNLVYVNHYGLQFYWDNNTTLESIGIHFITASLATIFYVFITQLRKLKNNNLNVISDKIWVILSLILLALIGILML